MAGLSDRQLYDLLIASDGYKAIGDVDKAKVLKAASGLPSKAPVSRIGRVAWELAKRFAKPPPPPPPPPNPPPYKKVAPRVAFAQGGSDARFCLMNPDGSLQPGVRFVNGKYTDDSGAIYSNLDGLDESGIRSGAPALTGARETDGRPYCSLPTMGEPTLNTGSWAI